MAAVTRYNRRVSKVAVVGSREFNDLGLVAKFVASLPEGTVVVSGGARGTDRAAEWAAGINGYETVIHRPDFPKGAERTEVIQALFARNMLIAEECDELHAFINWRKRSNGTFDTLFKALKLGKPVTVHYDDGSTCRVGTSTPIARKPVERTVYPWEG